MSDIIINNNALGEVNIYTLAHPITGEVRYVGKTKHSLKKRLSSHLQGSLNSKKRNYRYNWIKSLLDAGLVPVIELVDTVEYTAWRFWEQHYISLFKSWGFDLTNLTPGGDGVELTGETRQKQLRNLREAMKKFRGENNPSKRFEVREKIKQRMLGREISDEWRENMSKGGKGKKMPESMKDKSSERMKGNSIYKNYIELLTDEQRNKIYKERSEKLKEKYRTGELISTMKGKTHSSEARKKISEKRKGKAFWGKKVKQLNLLTGEEKVWNSANDANRHYFNKPGDNIASKIRLKKQYDNSIFEYINE